MKNNLLFLLLLGGIIGCSDDDMSGSVYGTVFTEDGSVPVNATMSLYRLESYYDEYDYEHRRIVLDQRKKTDDNGYYEFVNLSFVKEYQLTADLEGYATFSSNAVFLKNERMNIDVSLEKEMNMIVLKDAGIAVQKLNIAAGGITKKLAEELCAASIVDGYNDWRLPTLSELNSIYNYQLLLPNIKSSFYWSSTESDLNKSYLIDMKNGGIIIGAHGANCYQGNYYTGSNFFYARCVRSIQ